MPRAPRIAIIGGGIGGLTAALALERRGAEVIVCEQSTALSQIGAGLNLTPNAIKALRALGVEEKANAVGCGSEFLLIRSWKSGRYITRMRRGDFRQKFGAPNLTVHRADLLDVLSSALKTTYVRLGARCIAAEGRERGALARFADGSEIEADVVVGADGIHSVVRKCLFGPDAPRFTGCICWRGMAPASAVPPDIDIADGALWMGPHGHVVHYPVRRGELINIVAHFDSDAWTEESWTRECDVAEVMATYGAWNSALTRLFPCSERWYKWALYDRDPRTRFSLGRATLLGDSAHAMLPYLGQGAAMAIEDGCVLAAMIVRHGDDLSAALTEYERLRAPRTRAAVLGSRARARENHLASPLARLKRDVRFALRERFGRDNTAFQTGWLYEYDVGREGF
ncbi:MAG TPA: FAD-dependent monooxygenase [Xanthobacteraceae bacterium]|jgi:salicylate hydroxylase